MNLVIATGNAGKAKEFRQMLGDEQFSWFNPESIGVPTVEETGRTFRENACLKATAYARHCRKWAIADDSGLEVDALGNRPGIFSARWAESHGAGSGDAANNALLLRQLAEKRGESRSARFICVLALANPEGKIIVTTAGSMAGEILESPRGVNGFGYDPLFFVESAGRTTAELTPEHKHAISHRGVALRRMRVVLSRSDLTFR
jgi:XTP/dITP diphosphohydrolase